MNVSQARTLRRGADGVYRAAPPVRHPFVPQQRQTAAERNRADARVIQAFFLVMALLMVAMAIVGYLAG